MGISTDFSVGMRWVCEQFPRQPWYLYVCRLSHSCTLLKPFYRYTCHLAGQIGLGLYTCGFQRHTVLDGGSAAQEKGRLEYRTQSNNCNLLLSSGEQKRGAIPPFTF